MRYKCIGNPHCMKTFEYGHALRAHIASCDQAQKILKNKLEVEKLEHQINLEYPGIHGLHRNPHYPTAHNLDQTLKFDFNDKYKLNSGKNPTEKTNKRLLKSVNSNMMNSSDIKTVLNFQ